LLRWLSFASSRFTFGACRRTGRNGLANEFDSRVRWRQARCLVRSAQGAQRKLRDGASRDRRLAGCSKGYAPIFLAQGYSVLLPDSRSHGTSEGELVTYGLWEKYDVLDWARWMRQRNCQALYGLGESLGASVLIQAAALGGDFRAIAVESPFADLRTIGEYRVRQMFHLPAWLLVRNSMTFAKYRYGIDLRQASPIDSMRRSSTPTLLIHGLEDGRTPYWHSQVLARANSQSVLWLVSNAGHTGAYWTAPDEFRQRVLTWFASH
jgi:uncharacterized protein